MFHCVTHRAKPFKKMKIGIPFSQFDLLHAGHVKMVEEANRQCDYLIWGLQSDPPLNQP